MKIAVFYIGIEFRVYVSKKGEILKKMLTSSKKLLKRSNLQKQRANLPKGWGAKPRV